MNRLKETIVTMFLATRYSFSFCWRNSKAETMRRIVISVLNTVSMYLAIQATGFIINAVQVVMVKSKDVDYLQPGFFKSGIISPLTFLVITLLASVILNKFDWFYRSRWNQTLRYANQRELNNHRATLDVARFRSQEFDDLERRIDELPAGWSTRMNFSEEIFSLFSSVISFVLFGASLLWYKPIYALALSISALPMMFVEFKVVAMWWNLSQELVPQHKKRHMLQRPYSSTTPFIQAKMFNQMPALSREIDLNINGIIEAHNNTRLTILRNKIVTHSIVILGLCGVIAHGVWSTVSYGGGIGTLTIIMAAARAFQSNLISIVSLIAEQWNSAKGIILIEKDFLGLKPVVQTPYPVVPKFDIVPRIRFEHVSFKYPDTNVMVLEDVNFEIKPGTKVAIVGKSGNGKSTIQALLMRYYDPTSGSVFADNINLCNIEPSVWSNVASAMTQDYEVLERRIAEEIASSRLDQPVNLEAVTASARFANFEEVVKSDPKGYESQIGTEFGGRDFSGGERQRLALARVHYRGTPILILDEPDAKLDPESAQKVIDMVFALKVITVIIITHHISRAERCDNVIVMGKGKVVEQGTHQELMTQDGVYASMFNKDKKHLGTES